MAQIGPRVAMLQGCGPTQTLLAVDFAGQCFHQPFLWAWGDSQSRAGTLHCMSVPCKLNRHSALHTSHIHPHKVYSAGCLAPGSFSIQRNQHQRPASATLTWPTPSFPSPEPPREYSQLRRGGHPQQANARKTVVPSARGDHHSDRKDR